MLSLLHISVGTYAYSLIMLLLASILSMSTELHVLLKKLIIKTSMYISEIIVVVRLDDRRVLISKFSFKCDVCFIGRDTFILSFRDLLVALVDLP